MYTAIFFSYSESLEMHFKFEEICKSLKIDPLDFFEWTWYFDHITLHLGPCPKEWIGLNTDATINGIGFSDKAVAFRVDKDKAGGSLSLNETPHITLFTSPDGKPKDSNEITNWIDIEPFKVEGVINHE